VAVTQVPGFPNPVAEGGRPTLAWIAMIPVSIATGWVKSVTYVSALSLWALVSGHWSAWQAARVEVNQDRETAKRAKQDIAEDVVEKIVAETDVAPAET
jgi:hypothetical protein